LRLRVANRPKDPAVNKAIAEGSGVAANVGEKTGVLSPATSWLKSIPLT
jgi:hypothetical protein